MTWWCAECNLQQLSLDTRVVCSNMGIIKRNLFRPLPDAIQPLTPQVFFWVWTFLTESARRITFYQNILQFGNKYRNRANCIPQLGLRWRLRWCRKLFNMLMSQPVKSLLWSAQCTHHFHYPLYQCFYKSISNGLKTVPIWPLPPWDVLVVGLGYEKWVQ